MNYKTCKEQINSLIQVLEESFNVKENPITDYAVPILKNAIIFVDNQQLKIQKQKKALYDYNICVRNQKEKIEALKNKDNTTPQAREIKRLECELDEIKFKYFVENTELKGKIQDYERKFTDLTRAARLVTPRKNPPLRIWIKHKSK